VTAVFEFPVILAVNVADWPLVIEIQVGLTAIVIGGSKVTEVVRTLPLKSVALIVTKLLLAIVAGAV
jgi:hypothetical protein